VVNERGQSHQSESGSGRNRESGAGAAIRSLVDDLKECFACASPTRDSYKYQEERPTGIYLTVGRGYRDTTRIANANPIVLNSGDSVQNAPKIQLLKVIGGVRNLKVA